MDAQLTMVGTFVNGQVLAGGSSTLIRKNAFAQRHNGCACDHTDGPRSPREYSLINFVTDDCQRTWLEPSEPPRPIEKSVRAPGSCTLKGSECYHR